MKEDFLHYIWRYLKFDRTNLKTTDGQSLEIFHNGMYLKESGPDFFNAKIQIGNEVWAGNVEIHVNASDWYIHKHETDMAYQNVILHVVWSNDSIVVHQDGSVVPTLELKDKVSKELISSYTNALDQRQLLPCQSQWDSIDVEKIHWFQEELLLQKLHDKSLVIEQALQESNNYWEEVFCRLLFRSFGTKVNGESFERIFRSIPYAVIQKERAEVSTLEALLYGQSNLLPEEVSDAYTKSLFENFQFIKHKYQLPSSDVRLEYFKLRPDNFPSIRISQYAGLLVQHQSLFFELLHVQTRKGFSRFFQIQANEYWDEHYVFGKSTTKRYPKKLSTSFIDLLLINTILPMHYTYFKHQDPEAIERVISIYKEISFENNSISKLYDAKYFRKENAGNSQSLVYLNKEYCQKKKCLQCTIGTTILQRYD